MITPYIYLGNRSKLNRSFGGGPFEGCPRLLSLSRFLIWILVIMELYGFMFFMCFSFLGLV